jgi:hypothetical protein
VATQRNDELWRQLKTLGVIVECGPGGVDCGVARQRHERDAIVAEPGEMYKELIAVSRSTIAPDPPSRSLNVWF